ncbi:MAG: asparagine synthase (glutamine-hydrolyzing) [Rhodospirillaceae bacterium]|nr:asparagine synthase (glutamine-hydrolyzing) [Rhodospirillaceae bacterium]
MCGIVGGIKNRPEFNLSAAVASLGHRGPDGRDQQIISIADKQIGLGHTRLAIQDLSPAGQQPMQSRDKRWWITFNGEIYNHLTLRKAISGPFRGHSDTETLVELIDQQGMDNILPKLNGMFAFAALDCNTGKLYLVRDPFGIKPLYYLHGSLGGDDTFAFASEVRALRELGVIDAALDEEALQGFLSLRYLPSPMTLWKGVQRLKPGHVLCLDLGSMKLSQSPFVEPTSAQFSGSIDDAAKAYQSHLKAAVERQLLSDVPVGVLLSGGIDSALIAAMAKDVGRALPCFTVGFGDGHPECEIADAEETARVLGLPIASVKVTPQGLLDALPDIVRSIEEPLGTTSIMPMWFLVQRARQDTTVVLTGQGTDEPWGGYRRYQMEMVRRLMPYSGFWGAMRALGQIAGDRLPDELERGLRALPETDLASRAHEACALFSAQERQQLTGSTGNGGTLAAMGDWMSWLEPAECAPAESMMRVDTRMNLADDLLLYGDKTSMARSLEARVPMLDIELVNFVESLPLKYRLALQQSKIVHKKMAAHYLPPAIVQRPKRGFQVPFGEWSRGPWRDYIEDALLAADAPHLDYLDRGALSKLWQDHLSNRRDRSRQIFALLMLALWWRYSFQGTA